MALDDEEDNDLYGSSRKKKVKKRPCANCGAPTSFANAIGEREKLGWCPGCFEQREKESFVNKDGERVWRTHKSIVRPTPFDSGRGPK
jgi:hypothetical protein